MTLTCTFFGYFFSQNVTNMFTQGYRSGGLQFEDYSKSIMLGLYADDTKKYEQ